MANKPTFHETDPDKPLGDQARQIAENINDGVRSIEVNIGGLTEEEVAAKLAAALKQALINEFGDDWVNHIPVLAM